MASSTGSELEPSHRIADAQAARLWTPERVPLTLPLAGLGERALAYGVDLAIVVASFIAAGFIYNFWGDVEEDLSTMSFVGLILLVGGLLAFAIGYDIFFETVLGGRTPGKMLVKLRVLRSDGASPDFVTSSLRNLARLVDMLPSGYGVGALVIFLTGTKRVGDLLADTMVVSERGRDENPLVLCERALGDDVDLPPPPEWSGATAMGALSVLTRARHFEPALAERLAARFVSKDLEGRAPMGGVGSLKALAAGALALSRARTGLLSELRRCLEAERALMGALEALDDRPSLRTAEAADDAIRRAGSTLMRATRRSLPPRWLEPLSLALLDARRRRRAFGERAASVKDYLLRDVPRALVDERALVYRAAAVLSLAAILGGSLAYSSDAIARALVGDDIAALVDQGARWTDQIESDQSFAKTALTVIVNNIRVGFGAFIFGLLGGAGTLLLVAYNGLHLGAVFGFALRLGVAGTLGRFILAHGPVELTSICVAAAGGLCVGRAITAPGDRTRLEALREEGRLGARLLVAATLGFLFIGTVEGFVSPGRAFPWWANLSVGVAIWALAFYAVRTLGAMERSAPTTRAGLEGSARLQAAG